MWVKGQCIPVDFSEFKELGRTPNKWDCLDTCRALAQPITACEWQNKDGRCFVYTEEVQCNASGAPNFICYIFKTCGKTFLANNAYTQKPYKKT